MNRLLLLSLVLLVGFITPNNIDAQCSSTKSAKASNVSYEKDLVDIAIGSPDHETLVAAVKAADLVTTLKSEGPFTVFAPTDAAFGQLPDGTVSTLLKPENIGMLQSILTYHVVAGNFDSGAVVNVIKAGNGVASLTTVQGGTLKAMIVDGNVVLMDENGNKSTVTAVDLKGSNGVIHVIDAVILPKA